MSKNLIVGIDEVGRGCLAGPLVVAAVAWTDQKDSWLADSKQLSPKQRLAVFNKICRKANASAVHFQSAELIDTYGLSKALRVGFEKVCQQTLNNLTGQPKAIIIDGSINYLNHLPNSQAVIKADCKIGAVMAASILAKIVRDRFMEEIIAKRHPSHQFQNHKGYGTKEHKQALKQLGPIKGVHRFSFRPIKA